MRSNDVCEDKVDVRLSIRMAFMSSRLRKNRVTNRCVVLARRVIM